MGKCIVLFCKNRTVNKPEGVTFHRIPSEKYVSWMKAIGRNPDDVSPNNRICSEHFAQNSFVGDGREKTLKNDAVPTLKLKPEKYQFVKPKEIIATKPLETILTEPSTSGESIKKPQNIHSLEEQVEQEEFAFAEDKQCHLKTAVKRKLDFSSTTDSEGLRGPPKKLRRSVRMFHNYSVSPRKLKAKVQVVETEKRNAKQKLKISTAKVKRLSNKISSLKDVVKQLSKTRLMTDDAVGVLEKSYAHIPLSLMTRLIGNIKRGTPTKKTFPEELRSFAMTLQFYSSKAYEYVRRTFHLALPSPSVIRNWMSSIDCQPGFVSAAFDALKSKVAENKEQGMNTVCALMLDEMAIKRQIDHIGGKTWGYIDMGTHIQDDELKSATDVLVLMVVAVNGHWKLAFGYFFISGLSGKEKANIVAEAIQKLTETGVTIVSVTCDGPSAHFNMAVELGAEINEIGSIKPYFCNPLNNDDKIYFIFDACHLIKLLRNNWANLVVIVDGDNNHINYNLIKKLFEIQEVELLRFGTKLRKAHLEWQKQKMKVNLAVQMLSNSVADALEFLMSDIKHPDFRNASATIKFIRMADRIFDLCNSRNIFGRGCKTPLKPANENYWRPIIEEGIIYLQGLKTTDGLPLYQTRHKTPIKGFIITLTSLLGIYDEYVKENEMLKYILTYKLSQDHLELFFFNVRSRYGSNNNPTAYQFSNTFKRLISYQEIQKGSGGNCVVQDETSVLKVPSTSKPKFDIEEISIDEMSYVRRLNLTEVSPPDHDYIDISVTSLSLLSENVITYISGFIIKKIKKILKCETCLLSLEYVSDSSVDDTYYLLLNRKNRGGLIKPAKDVIEILKYVESQIRLMLIRTGQKLPNENNFIYKFCQQLYIKVAQDNKYFYALSDHVFDTMTFQESHLSKLIKLIILHYLKIRFFSIAKKQTEVEKGDLIRKKLSKTILFSHQ